MLSKRHIREAPDWKARIHRIHEHLGRIEDIELHWLSVECHTLNRVGTALQDREITRRQEELLRSIWERGREGGKEGGKEGGREGGKEGGRWMEGGREGGREVGREGGREGGRDGEREVQPKGRGYC